MTYFFVDVESMGLHGDPFSVGVVITDEKGSVLDEFCYTISRFFVKGYDFKWVDDNIPATKITHGSTEEMLKEFWITWKLWKAQGAIMVCDCPWPVETRFLNMCMEFEDDKFSGPYPLIDLASMYLALGQSPVIKRDRQSDELPVHHPLCDARQTKRLFFELKGQ